jgi:hypothetical protein
MLIKKFSYVYNNHYYKKIYIKEMVGQFGAALDDESMFTPSKVIVGSFLILIVILFGKFILIKLILSF